jgi:two-component system nitrogen regulation sensor histidine kinase NtrY
MEGTRAAPTGRERSFARIARLVGYVTIVVALAVATLSFFHLLDLTPIRPTVDTIWWVWRANVVIVGLLVLLTGWEAVALYRARRRGRSGARLHVRIVALFSLVAVVPAVLVAIISTVTINRGLEVWFSQRTEQIVQASVAMAGAFLDTNLRKLSIDMTSVQPEFELAIAGTDQARFQSFVDRVATGMQLALVAVVQKDGTVIARSTNASDSLPMPPPSVFPQADASALPIMGAPTDDAPNLVAGVLRLTAMPDRYLYALRGIDPAAISLASLVFEGEREYATLQAARRPVTIGFGVIYVGSSLILLLSVMWIGIALANRIAAPIGKLIDATDAVAKGNLNTTVPVRNSDGDIGALASTFNKMTAQLRGQRRDLLDASEQIDSRRRFTEAVLSGVTAGVIGVDGAGVVRIVNRAGLRLLACSQEAMLGRAVTKAVPELAPIVSAALASDKPENRGQVMISRANRDRTVNVRMTREKTGPDGQGYVITLDDITDLVSAQRTSAWADIARRIAHEIKNPLTPIQLSAERLKRRFGKVIVEDRAIFDQCTDTIIRQVGDIGRMVDEFSAFARMPKPEFEEKDLTEVLREAAFLQQVAHPDLAIDVRIDPKPLLGRFDLRLLTQAFTNVVKNATEAIAAVPPEQRGQGQIAVEARHADDCIVVDVVDNGVGLPKENRDRLLEPYMTTREKGTGLGLAIVRKIVEEHGGKIELLDAPAVAEGGRGALVRITLPGVAHPAAPGKPAIANNNSNEPALTGT